MSGAGDFFAGLLGYNLENRRLEKQQKTNLAQAGQRATTTFGESQQALAPTLGFNTKLLSGDPATAMGAIGPEANTILAQYDTARKAVSQNAPRGGGATRTMANAPFAAAGQVTDLLNKSRRGAAQELGGLFSQLAGTSQGYTGQVIQGTTDTMEEQMKNMAAEWKRQSEIGAAIAGGLGG